ncbi:hypothetical protein P175DRAFT_0483945 [Aspergillus ochraceoroseus IBT 24754]|uniref:BTB domain-containing protein n=3 Tax=Aspergillus subgen. Nidulantes TaxID=2720870 RepID=A0A2T5LQU3_9EURO|nr:uncharacterized protein P175DRAFT_0483945 [Aspergillus ochraceoroseus IBT 24754]KKK23251.1 hypothetical protein AOCH_001201 [Aspergillus ochraceoroseus]PTU18652.1 hypothetical protein P175DRAFT_0483945 [Aspergillus ochraceoroseus IBT 24754]
MDLTPQVRVAGSEDVTAPSTQNTANVDTETTLAPGAIEESQADQTQDITLPDAELNEAESQPTEEPQPAEKKPIHFLDFLASPIIELVIGSGDNRTTMTAHQNLLLESPALAEKVKAFGDGPRKIELPDDDVEAFGCFLQYQYTHDYSTPDCATTQTDSVGDRPDNSGEQLLKHARVYTLAGKLGIPALRSLAHSKIHRIDSTSLGELTYARYVYANTPADDTTIRKPVSSFWGSRSHVLRHETGAEFKKLCLDVPEFCYDVLSHVLDQKEKRAHDKVEAESGTRGSARKRLRSGL